MLISAFDCLIVVVSSHNNAFTISVTTRYASASVRINGQTSLFKGVCSSRIVTRTWKRWSDQFTKWSFIVQPTTIIPWRPTETVQFPKISLLSRDAKRKVYYIVCRSRTGDHAMVIVKQSIMFPDKPSV